ncbi:MULTISPECIES: valine--tRNA ligase [Corynebacterium]|uniref:valine--tRNA ligase n=1 Tax=Corynebacterium TaxID=1716 RepID=UPI001EF2555D|nr:valine--tRNA ligase [Corynebacterium kefirresidentii]MCG7240546.1 valine--tRNA ligase [Corynebacterium kefirresidentii]MCG7282752.1 valine--tRNA ligase [Corynebacterium kefirresidentii]MCG7449685.1 valine--tRNA ligase [Corynebacterium kefirresidentii]MCG7451881.1 valine--tRNA ligase [Corynebacterium kefirresidentii]MCT2188960.1 valine--tRNA ligase [Corynebacterium kefirresidentii]
MTEQNNEQLVGTNRADALPKSWEPQAVEKDLYEGWVEKGYFTPDAHSEAEPYSIVLPPPNVTGQLHMGHALDHTLIDSIIRRKRMQGYATLWLPGADHAGIATQTKVEAKLKETEGKKRWDYEREEFIDKVWEWKEQYGGTIQNQMRAIGDSVDWSRERFTLDDGLSRAVQTIFKNLYDEGMIYQANRLVNWSPVLETAVSDIEVVYKDVEGELVSIRYGSLNDDEPHLIVATTRVETMLGDVAIAVHPDDERYADLVGKELPHPFRDDLKLKIIADDYVDMEFGTGAVKITPAHDPNDYAMGTRHNLDMPTVMDTTGHIANTGTRFDGLTREEARVEIREALREQGRIVKEIRPYVHSVGHSERSGEPIEPRLSLQWFVDVSKMAKDSGAAVREGDTTLHPQSLEPRYFEWVDDMHDWCISRQLWWGHRIPIWYGPEGEDGQRDIVCVGPDEEPPAGYEQDPDVLDTWFSSALWPFSTLGWPEKTPDLEKFYPTNVLVTAYDILFFWVARMMMFGTFAGAHTPELLGEGTDGRPQVPFKDLYLHGLVRDEQGRKMSKSLGNGIDPMDWVRDYGADALRFTLARGANPGVDLPLGSDAAAAARNFATKLFNATKFALMNGAGVATLPNRDELSDADRWILDRAEEVRAKVDAYLDDYQFAKANELLYHFTWDELCDWYLEIAKTQIPRDGVSEQGRNTQIVLGRVLDVVLRLLHPTMPFVTEVLWKALTGGESIVVAPWPTVADTNGGATKDEVAARRIADADKLITELRRFRSDQGVKPSQKVPGRLDFAAADLSNQEELVRNLANTTAPAEDFDPSASIEVRLSQATVEVTLDTHGAVDVEAERKRLEKDLAKANKELEQTGKKLGNENFLSKAPEEVVNKIKQRQQIAREEVERITSRLEGLK